MKGDDNERVYSGKLYTLRHCFDPWTGRIERGWVGYCGPDRVGWFRTKADFWKHVELIECVQLDAACVHALDVERQAAIEGAKLLDRLHLWNGWRRNEP